MSAIEIPGYKIVKTLGIGGQATVYLAIQQGFDREVALKVMSPALAADPTFGERFIREAKIVSKLSHSSIVTVYDVGESGNFYYLAMEYMQGAELKTRISKGVKAKEALLIVARLAKALDFAHRKGYIHRDVKSENILFDNDNLPVLTDFGIAKASNSATQMTQTGKLIGTPEYMSPEQCRGRKLDGGSDLYGLGIILFEMLTRKVPFTGEDSVSVCIQHVTKPVPQLPARFSHLQWLIDSLLAKKRSERFKSGMSLANAIESYLVDGHAVSAIQGENDDFPTTSTKDSKIHKKAINSSQTKASEPNVTQVGLDSSIDDFDEQSFELHDDFEVNQRINVMPESSGIVSKVIYFLLFVGIAFGGFQYRTFWVPHVQEYFGLDLFNSEVLKPNNAKGKPSKLLAPGIRRNNKSESGQLNDSMGMEPKNNPKIGESSRQVADLIRQSNTLLEYQPHELSDIRQALENLTTVKSLAPDNAESTAVKKKILDVAISEANNFIEQKKFDVAEQWIQLVEFADSNNANLRSLKLQIEQKVNEQVINESKRKAKVEEFDQLIVDANEAIAKNRLSSPEKNNAIYFARQADSLKPQSESVRLLFSTVENKYVTLIEAAIKSNQYSKARRYLESLQSLPNISSDHTLLNQRLNVAKAKHEKLQKAKQRLAALATQRKQKEKKRAQMLSDPLIQMKLQSNLQSAADLVLQGNLVKPVGSNALEKYRAVLEIDLLDSAAIDGIKKIEEAIITNLEVAISNSLLAAAKEWLSKLEIYDDKDLRITEYSRQVEEIELAEQLKQEDIKIEVLRLDSDKQTDQSDFPENQIKSTTVEKLKNEVVGGNESTPKAESNSAVKDIENENETGSVKPPSQIQNSESKPN